MARRTKTSRGTGGKFTGKTAENTGASTEAGTSEESSSTGAATGDDTGAGTGADSSATGQGAGPLGTVAVEVDRDALLREADRVAADAPPAPGVSDDPAQELAPQLPASERAAMAAPALRAFVSTGANVIAPNWQITPTECAAIGDALAEVLAHWMPDTDIPPKYMALFTLGMALTGVVWQRRDDATGEWRPLRAPPPKKAPAATGAAPVAPAPGPAPLRL